VAQVIPEQIQLYLDRALRRNRLPHALAFIGEDTQAIVCAAQTLACRLLCPAPSPSFCCQCSSCKRVMVNSHPNVNILQSIESHQLAEIHISQVRNIIHQSHLSAYTKGPRVTIIPLAHRMTNQSANALLKTLEEPRCEQYFVLAFPSRAMIRATIASRCAKFFFAHQEESDLENPAIEELVECLESSKTSERLSICEKLSNSKDETIQTIDGLIKRLSRNLKSLGANDSASLDLLFELLNAKSSLFGHGNPRLILEKLFLKN